VSNIRIPGLGVSFLNIKTRFHLTAEARELSRLTIVKSLRETNDPLICRGAIERIVEKIQLFTKIVQLRMRSDAWLASSL
jgi:hypothetical protein